MRIRRRDDFWPAPMPWRLAQRKIDELQEQIASHRDSVDLVDIRSRGPIADSTAVMRWSGCALARVCRNGKTFPNYMTWVVGLSASGTTEATHPQMPGAVVAGSSTFEWLDGERFLIFRSHYEHPELPDAVSIIGDTEGLHMHYFDSRGVHRIYELTIVDDGWVMAMASVNLRRTRRTSTRPSRSV